MKYIDREGNAYEDSTSQDKLLELERQPNLIGDKWNTLTGRTMAMNEEMFYWEDAQLTIFDVLDYLED